jgi:hypothetical protein
MAEIDFHEAYDTYVKAHQKVWAHDRSKTMGASEAFGCLRKAWFSKHGTEKDPDHKDSWGALQRGDLIEQHFAEPAVRWFLENEFHDARLIWGGQDQKTLKAPDAPLTATPDGLVINADDDALALYGIPSLGGTGCFNFEIKSIDPRVNLREEKAIHRGQTIVQMGTTRETTEYRPNYAVIVYLDASFFDDIDIFVVPFDQQTYDVAKTRSRAAFDIKNPADIMAEGKVDGACEYCPFKLACARVSKVATPDKGEANMGNTPSKIMQEFEALVMAERSASAGKKALEKDHKEASEKLKMWFQEVGVKRAEVPGVVKASITWVKGRKSFDTEGMIQAIKEAAKLVAALEDAGLDPADYIDEGVLDHEQYIREGEGHSRLSISEKGSTSADET